MIRFKPKKKMAEALKKIFPIDKDNPDTWPWLDFVVSGRGKHASIRWIKNPKFEYGHLIQGY